MMNESALSRIFLVGPMGSGKTSVGRHLAKLLEYEFFDSDAEVQARAGADITWIFDKEGEVGFRSREKTVIEDLAGRSQVVIATGGGSVVTETNCILMSQVGIVIFLKVSVDEQFQRTRLDRNRPLLERPDRYQVLSALMLEREPIYTELADFVVSSASGSALTIAREIRQLLEA